LATERAAHLRASRAQVDLGSRVEMDRLVVSGAGERAVSSSCVERAVTRDTSTHVHTHTSCDTSGLCQLCCGLAELTSCVELWACGACVMCAMS
jgi:hypothetical protein